MKSTVSVVIMLSLALLLCSCQPKEDSRIGELESRVEALEEEVKVIKEATQNSKAKKIATRENQTEAEVIINQEKEIVLGEPILLSKDGNEGEICFNSVQKFKGRGEYAQWYVERYDIGEKLREKIAGGESTNEDYLFFEGHIKNVGTLPLQIDDLFDKIDIKQNGFPSKFFNVCFDNKYNYGIETLGVDEITADHIHFLTSIRVGLFEEKDVFLLIEVPDEFRHSPYKLTFISNGITYYYEGKQ